MGDLIVGTCSTCRFYKQLRLDQPKKDCTARPPSAGLIPAGADSSGQPVFNVVTFYPKPEPGWTCGEHRPEFNV